MSPCFFVCRVLYVRLRKSMYFPRILWYPYKALDSYS